MVPTRVSLTTTSIIDHIATTCARNIVGSGVHEISMIDPHMINCIQKFNGEVEKDHKMIKARKTKNFNEDEFLANVSAICWEQLATDSDNISRVVSKWSNLFFLTIDKHAPLTEMRVSEKYCPG